jgi:hypothetical protein
VGNGPGPRQIFIQAPIKYPSDLYTSLNRAGLRPLPEYRNQIINALISVMDSLHQPTTLSEVRTILAEKLPLISKSALQDTLKTIVRSNCFLNGNGETVRTFGDPVSKLVSSDVTAIEKKCLESYVSVILARDKNYFDSPQNIKDFEKICGGKLPDKIIVQTTSQEANATNK